MMKPFKEKFKRIETKYIISKAQWEQCQAQFHHYLEPNEYAQTTISNLYYDTPTFALIRQSLDKPNYKEKLRMRSYDKAVHDMSEVFIEVKKKFQKVVYKRRVKATLAQAVAFLEAGELDSLPQSQVRSEIQWLQARCERLEPKMFIYYDRYAMQGKEDSDLRITIDYNLRYRYTDVSLASGTYGEALLDEDYMIMEIKSSGAYPVWLTQLLSQVEVYKSSFSKYGTAYKLMKKQGEIQYDQRVI